MIFPSTFKKPVLIVGNGVRSSNATPELHKLIKKAHIPTLTTMNSVDLIQDQNKIGFIGTYGNRVANIIVSECDLVIAIGARLGLRQIGNKKEYFAPKASLIRVDIDEYELGRTVKDDEKKVLMDAKDYILALLEEDIPDYLDWFNRCLMAKNILDDYDKELGNKCIEKISSLLPMNPIVTVDVGQNQCWCAQSLTLKGEDGRILIGGGYGSMGCSLPFAIGSSISLEKKKVYCITGDGGLQMNIQELQTVVTEKLPIKIIVINNHTLGKISEIQRLAWNNRMMITTEESGYHVPDFSKISEAYGVKSVTLKSFEDLDLYEEWLDDEEPCLINVELPDNTVLQPKMNWNDKDMKPSLCKEVIERVRLLLNSG